MNWHLNKTSGFQTFSNKIFVQRLCLPTHKLYMVWMLYTQYNSLVLITYILNQFHELFFLLFNTFSFPNPDNVNGNLDVCNRNKRGGTGGWKLFHDIKVSVVYLFAFFLFLFIFSFFIYDVKNYFFFSSFRDLLIHCMTWIR